MKSAAASYSHTALAGWTSERLNAPNRFNGFRYAVSRQAFPETVNGL